MFFKIRVLKNVPIFTGKHPLESLLNKSYRSQSLQLCLKENPANVLSCEYCEIFKNSFFIEHLGWLLLEDQGYGHSSEFYLYLDR